MTSSVTGVYSQMYCVYCDPEFVGRVVSKSVALLSTRKLNRPFPSSLVPLFQSESKCETILMKMTLKYMEVKLHTELIFIMKGFAFRLGLKQTREISEMAHSLDKQTVDSSFQLDQNILALL